MFLKKTTYISILFIFIILWFLMKYIFYFKKSYLG